VRVVVFETNVSCQSGDAKMPVKDKPANRAVVVHSRKPQWLLQRFDEEQVKWLLTDMRAYCIEAHADAADAAIVRHWLLLMLM
jgi:chemotaxis regulatin CheY-phosphate phosphatase CheZ